MVAEIEARAGLQLPADGPDEDVVDQLLDADEGGDLAAELHRRWLAVQVGDVAREGMEVAVELRWPRDQFVLANQGLIHMSITRHAGSELGSELLQQGNLGLIRAVARFDPRRGLRFSTYAMWWIRHEVGRYLAQRIHTVRVPLHVKGRARQVERARAELRRQFAGVEPTLEQIAERAELETEEVERTIAAVTARCEPFELARGEDRRRPADYLVDLGAPDPVATTDLRRFNARLDELLAELPDREAAIVRARFGLDGAPRTLQEVAGMLGLSRERVRQLEARALRRMRSSLERPRADAA